LRQRPWVALDEGYTSSRDGNDFGLHIVENIAEAHGWEVVAVDGNDDGARFEVRFTTSPSDG
jgi:signal transduction histidine kinase